MHIHILGICGTFMGGLAGLAREMGVKVTGSDSNPYPPMSTQLETLGIQVSRYDPANLEPKPDIVVIGNALSRGNPEVEAVLDQDLNYISGPQWLSEHFLRGRHVLAVAGTHGKTTTSSMLAWILEYAGQEPGFLIGGIPQNFGMSARAGAGRFFVIEADEYDTAFFDKRSKFVHYRPKTLVLNNLEFDHADIFPDLDAIKQQFHFLLRTVPGSGRLIINNDDAALQDVIAAGTWSETAYFGLEPGDQCEWSIDDMAADFSGFMVTRAGSAVKRLQWELIGRHNAANALAAIAAADNVGVAPEVAIDALGEFKNVRRRMEVRGIANDITVYDDFAHHPTAIASTLDGLRNSHPEARIIAVLEPRSNTMKMGVHSKSLVASLDQADIVYIYQPADLGWDISELVPENRDSFSIHTDIDKLASEIVAASEPGDKIIVMSNGGFGGIHEKVLRGLDN
jgi:UDP-N-acetylmuramate: L-alanyl-gamma-D-glutamyl-meso-diaminopimelate ligase